MRVFVYVYYTHYEERETLLTGVSRSHSSFGTDSARSRDDGHFFPALERVINGPRLRVSPYNTPRPIRTYSQGRRERERERDREREKHEEVWGWHAEDTALIDTRCGSSKREGRIDPHSSFSPYVDFLCSMASSSVCCVFLLVSRVGG